MLKHKSGVENKADNGNYSSSNFALHDECVKVQSLKDSKRTMSHVLILEKYI